MTKLIGMVYLRILPIIDALLHILMAAVKAIKRGLTPKGTKEHEGKQQTELGWQLRLFVNLYALSGSLKLQSFWTLGQELVDREAGSAALSVRRTRALHSCLGWVGE